MVDFSKAATLPNSVQVINCTPHPLIFAGNPTVTVQPCGAKLMAKASDAPVGQRGPVELVKPKFEPTQEGLAELESIEVALSGVLVVGSMLSAQAYPTRVVSPTPAAGFERKPAEERQVNPNKFTVYPV